MGDLHPYTYNFESSICWRFVEVSTSHFLQPFPLRFQKFLHMTLSRDWNF